MAGHKLNNLAYADDVCMVASSKPELQGLLDRCDEFAAWAGFVFNTRKCGSLCLMNQPSRVYVDHLFTPHLGAKDIPALTWSDRYKYLGCPTGAYRTTANVLNELRDSMLQDTSSSSCGSALPSRSYPQAWYGAGSWIHPYVQSSNGV